MLNLNLLKSLFASSSTSECSDKKRSTAALPIEREAGTLLPREIPRTLATMLTHAWKAKQRLSPRPGCEATDEERRLIRHLDAILDAAAEIKLCYKDRTGEVYDYGLPEKVVASEPQIGLIKPVVKETIRPTVLWYEQIIAHGEVVLSVPPPELAAELANDESSKSAPDKSSETPSTATIQP